MISRSDVVAIIPARGGSKGVPRKNLQHVGGVPLIERCVRTALRAEMVSAVYVSTDDIDIANLAERAGAGINLRPQELSGDDASSESVLLHVVECMKRGGVSPAVLVFMQCTSPFTSPADVDRTIAPLLDGAIWDCAFTVTPCPLRVWARVSGDGSWSWPVDHEPGRRAPRQHAARTRYYENGAVYAMRMSGFLEHRCRIFGDVTTVEMPPERSLEIDTPHDLLIARAICNLGTAA